MGNKTRKRNKKWTWSKFKKDERASKILGAILLLSAIYLAIAFISYFYTWKIDQDKVLRFSWSILWQGDLTVQNWLGRLGAVLSNLFFYWGFGLPSLFVIAVLCRYGWIKLRGKRLGDFTEWTRNIGIITLFSSIALEYIFTNSSFPWGGAFGESSCIWLSNFIGQIGLGILLAFSVIIFLIWTFNPDFKKLDYALQGIEGQLRIPKPTFSFWPNKSFTLNPFKARLAEDADLSPIQKEDNDEWEDTIVGEIAPQQSDTCQVDLDVDTLNTPINERQTRVNLDDTELEIEDSATSDLQLSSSLEQDVTDIRMESVLHIKEENRNHSEPYDPTADLSKYKRPDLDLLIDYQSDVHIDREELEAKKNQIISTLRNYKIEIKKIKATVGPTVTLYEIVPAEGIRISKIKSLEDDIALSLAALGIRIIAPIPGKGTIGIEVPNKKRQVVALKEILKSDKFQNAKMDLPIALGKTISNEVFVADLAKMPHLLIAGATGQGKSVGINAVLMSLLYKKHPSQVKLVLIDPKKVELPIYNELDKHFLAFLPDQDEAIITDTTKVIHTLNSLCIEMDERYELLKKARARNIKEYNKKFTERKLNPNNGHRFLPFIVLVIDEFADLIMTAGKEIELPIARLAQLARAIGIHLIIATQRPSVKIITGHIKANFPARIAFRVTSLVDSKTILDSKGAEQLIGKGDMLLAAGSDVVRLQCAFVDTPEVEKVITAISDQKGYPEPYFLPEYKGDEEGNAGGQLRMSDLDAMFEESARLVINRQHGSTSMIQRRLQLGYNRAGRIMDQLEQMGIVGEANGSKPREVLMFSIDEFERLMEQIKSRI